MPGVDWRLKLAVGVLYVGILIAYVMGYVTEEQFQAATGLALTIFMTNATEKEYREWKALKSLKTKKRKKR